MMTIGALLALAAVGCSNAFAPPPGTPHMSGTWHGAATNVAFTVILGSVQPCKGFCLPDSGPITGGSYTDATLSVQGSIPAGGYYIVSPCYCATPQTDIAAWSITMYPNDIGGGVTDAGSVMFSGSFTSATTVVGTVYFFKGAAVDSVAITMVKQ